MKCCLNCKWITCENHNVMFKPACDKYICDDKVITFIDPNEFKTDKDKQVLLSLEEVLDEL